MSDGSHADTLRRLYPQVLARTLGLTRALPDAEDAVHDALERALLTWPTRGVPDSPKAWLITVAGNAYRDRLRRRKHEDRSRDALEALSLMSPWARIAVAEPEVVRGWKDELLGLLFACCHPALNDGESAALALATVIGLSTTEIASAFVVAPRTMEQRLARARRRLRSSGQFQSPTPDQSQDRLDAVLRTIHLLFNEGYWSNCEDKPIRAELCRLAIGLGRSLLEAFPTTTEAAGLLALLLLHDARRDARVDAHGSFIALPDQDRSRWDRDAITTATQLLETALNAAQPGPLQTEAAIAAVHCRAPSAEETDWEEIAQLYALLERFRPIAAVRVNRAFAESKASGPAAGLALLEACDIPGVGAYPYVHLVRGTLLAELGRTEQARDSLLLAQQHARNPEERDQVGRQLRELFRRATAEAVLEGP